MRKNIRLADLIKRVSRHRKWEREEAKHVGVRLQLESRNNHQLQLSGNCCIPPFQEYLGNKQQGSCIWESCCLFVTHPTDNHPQCLMCFSQLLPTISAPPESPVHHVTVFLTILLIVFLLYFTKDNFFLKFIPWVIPHTILVTTAHWPSGKCSPMVQETQVQFQVASYQRFLKWYLIPPCLTLSNIRYVSRVKWSDPGKGVPPSPTPQYSIYIAII